jgi:hypothetical protein
VGSDLGREATGRRVPAVIARATSQKSARISTALRKANMTAYDAGRCPRLYGEHPNSLHGCRKLVPAAAGIRPQSPERQGKVNDEPEPIVTVHRLSVPVRHADDIVERLRQFLPEAAAELDGLTAVTLFRAVAYPDIAIVAHWRSQAARAAAAEKMSTHPTLVCWPRACRSRT